MPREETRMPRMPREETRMPREERREPNKVASLGETKPRGMGEKRNKGCSLISFESDAFFVVESDPWIVV
jgi:hypothetical protein